MDREAWHAAVHGVTKSQTGLNDWTEQNWMPKGNLKSSIVLTSHTIEDGKISEPFGPKPPHYNWSLQNLCSCQNLHSQFMTEAGKRPGVLSLIAPLATFFPEIGLPYLKNKSSSISNDFIYKLIYGNTIQKVHSCTWWKLSSVQSLSHVWLFVTPWIAARHASLLITNSQSYSNSCPLIRWCHPSISSSVFPFSSCLQSFQVSQLLPSGAKVLQFHV